MQTFIPFSFLHITCTCSNTHKPMLSKHQNLQRKMIRNQNREEGKCGPISFQNPIWNNKNSKPSFYPNLNQLSNCLPIWYLHAYLSIPNRLTCPFLMLPTYTPNITPPYFRFHLRFPSWKKKIITRAWMFTLVKKLVQHLAID
jgi:hypothetical protein